MHVSNIGYNSSFSFIVSLWFHAAQVQAGLEGIACACVKIPRNLDKKCLVDKKKIYKYLRSVDHKKDGVDCKPG